MTRYGAISTFEVERKYAVDAHAALPPAESFAAVGLTIDRPELHEMRATYFDTPEGALAAQRLALRHRSGGKDSGWHLKAKGDEGVRELCWPESHEMPAGLREALREKGVNHAAVVAIATVQTTRETTVVRDASGRAVIELADDSVDATNERTGRRQQWREWEAELLPGADPGADSGAALLDLLEPLLTAAGATRVRDTSKIQRAMQQEG